MWMRFRSGLVLVAVIAAPAGAQWQPKVERSVHSCRLADSLIGPMTHGGSVYLYHKVQSDSFRIYNHGAFLTASLDRVGALPQPYPTPPIVFVVDGRQGRALLAQRSQRHEVTITLDDTVHLSLGDGAVGTYSGPPGSERAPLTVLTDPASAIRIARANRFSVMVDTFTLKGDGADLHQFAMLYRFATCDTIR